MTACSGSDFELLKSLCARASGVLVSDLECATRCAANVAFARQILCYLANTMLGLNYTEVGALIGRDRATIRHACEVIEDRRDDITFDAFVSFLEDAFRLVSGATITRPPELSGRPNHAAAALFGRRSQGSEPQSGNETDRLLAKFSP